MNGEARAALVPLILADIFELAGRFRASGEEIASRVGQTQARWQVMSAASVGPLTVPQVARRLGVSRQNVQRIANQLVNEGWAAFETNPDHRGSPHLVLNQRGQAALAQLTETALGSHVELARRLGGTELGALHHALRRLIAAVDDHDISPQDGAQQ